MTRPPGVLYSTEIDPPADRWVTPRVRAYAAEAGIDLAAVAGTGIGGRIRISDLPVPAAPEAEAAEIAEVTEIAEVAATRSVFAVEADVTARGAGLPALLKAVIDADQLTEYAVVVRVDGHLVYVPGLRDLNEDGIAHALADPAFAKVDPAHTLLVEIVPDAMFAVPAWDGPALALGAPVRRPAVVRLPGGGEGIGIRTVAQLTLSINPYVPDATAFLAAVASRLS